MALKLIDHGSFEYTQMVSLRNEILRKPLGMELSPEEIALEKDEILIGAFEDEKMLGCCMLVKVDPELVRLRQMAVINNQQGKGIGASMLNFAENIARDRGFRKITMHARESAIGFYTKLGYTVSSDVFTEISIPHYKMEKVI